MKAFIPGLMWIAGGLHRALPVGIGYRGAASEREGHRPLLRSRGFSEVPEFLQPTQKSREITERIQTPRGSFYLCGMTREQMEADGYGFHHASEDGKYLIMANGTQAYAVRADAPEKDNPLRTAEMTLEDDYGMIDGVINNGRRGEELEKAREHAERTQPEKKPSIRERLAAAKQECAKQQPRPAPEKKPPELGER